jgi:gliding motility-associated-like protein
MLKRIKNILILIICSINAATGQQYDYVTNGSFETIDSCYGNFSVIGEDVFHLIGCIGWSNPIGSSSDHFCGNPKTNPPYVGTPELYQNPKSGLCMGGFLVNDGIVKNYREYLQNELSIQMKPNSYYEISFFISATNLDCSPSQLGVKFFSTPLVDSNKLWLTELIPDAVNNHTIFYPDTTNWQKVTMYYQAKGFEKYMILGNFQDSSKISYSLPCDSSYWTDTWRGIGNYFFIDDVSVIEATPELIIPNVFTPNGDGKNDTFKILAKNIGKWQCYIYNRWGQEIEQLNNEKIEWDGSNFPNGTYYYVFNSDLYNKTGSVTLINNQ